MRRRDFLVAAGTTATWPLTAFAQQGERTKLICALLFGSETQPEQRAWFTAFREEISRQAATDGRRVRIEERWVTDVEKVRALAAELVALQPDVLFALATPVVAALHAETSSIPLVFVGVSDPVGAKFVASFHRPGGNITGFVQNERSLGGKWISLLKEIAPDITQATIMFNPETAPGHGEFFLNSFEAAAESLGVKPRTAPVRNEQDILNAVKYIGIEGSGLILTDDGYMGAQYRTVVAAAMTANVPTVCAVVASATEGGLLAYHTDMTMLFRNAAGYVNRVFRGEAPADLPVQTPTKYELVINLKVATALHLAVPAVLLAAADEVVE